MRFLFGDPGKICYQRDSIKFAANKVHNNIGTIILRRYTADI